MYTSHGGEVQLLIAIWRDTQLNSQFARAAPRGDQLALRKKTTPEFLERKNWLLSSPLLQAFSFSMLVSTLDTVFLSSELSVKR